VSGAPACGAKKRAPARGEPRALMETLRFWGFQPEPGLALVLWLSETQSGKSYGCACFIGSGWFFSVAGPSTVELYSYSLQSTGTVQRKNPL
jgi:hypothetical protein